MKPPLNSNLTQKVSLAFTIKIAGAGTAFLVHLFLARALGPEEYGAFSYGMTIALMAVLLARLGLDTAALRIVGGAWPDDCETIRAYHRFSWRTTGLASAVVSITLLATGLLLAAYWNQKMGMAIAISAVIIPGATLTALGSAELRGMGAIVKSMLPEELLRPLILLIGVVAGLSLLPNTVSGSSIGLAGAGIAYGISAILVLRWIANQLPTAVNAPLPAQRRKWLSIGLPLIAVSGFNLLLTRTDILVIGSMLGPVEAGVYAAAGKFTLVTISIVMAANTIAAPLIARHYTEGDLHALQRLVSGVLRIVILVTVPVSLALSYFGPSLLGLLGESYVTGSTVLTILALGFAMNATMSLVGIILNMTGAEKFSAMSLGLIALVNISLDLVLIPIYGIEGGAIATVFSKLLWNLAALMYLQRHLNIRWLDILLARNLADNEVSK